MRPLASARALPDHRAGNAPKPLIEYLEAQRFVHGCGAIDLQTSTATRIKLIRRLCFASWSSAPDFLSLFSALRLGLNFATRRRQEHAA